MKSKHVYLLAVPVALGLLVAPTAGASSATVLPEAEQLALGAPDLVYLPLPERFDAATGAAQTLAEANPETFALVWFDGKDLVLDVVDEELVSSVVIPEGVVLREVQNSMLELRRAQEALNLLMRSPVGRESGAWMTFIDPRANRAVLGVSRPSDALREALVKLGEPVAYTSVLDPGLKLLSRASDTSPFTAGAKVSGSIQCTSGFSWTGQGAPAMLTAGHCVPSGGTVSVPNGTYGSVTSGSGENWASGTGTVLFPGDTVYRGDLAVATVTSPGTTQGKIYVGAAGSSSRKAVWGLWSRSPLVGDAYCTGGAHSGELCNWTVATVNTDVYLGSELVRNVSLSSAKTGSCLQPGDSGGPVYTNRVDGKVTAKGVVSIGSGGGDDFIADEGDPCYSAFSDARQVIPVFGGTAQTA